MLCVVCVILSVCVCSVCGVVCVALSVCVRGVCVVCVGCMYFCEFAVLCV